MMVLMVNKVVKIFVIDFLGENQEQVVKEFVEVVIEYGFIYIKNIGKDIFVDVVYGVFDMVLFFLQLSLKFI